MLLQLILAISTLPTDSTTADPVRETAEYRACRAAGSSVSDQTVRVSWTQTRTLEGDVDVFVCVMRGTPDASPAFLRNADHVVFALLPRGDKLVQPTVSFDVVMASGRVMRLGPAWIRVHPDAGFTCRIDICETFGPTDDRVLAVNVREHRGAEVVGETLTQMVR